VKSPEVTGHLSEGSFVQSVVVQIPKFDAKSKYNHNLALTLTIVLTLIQTLTLALTLCLYILDK